MLKIPVAEPEFDKSELAYVSEAVKSGWVSSKGAFIEEFEEQFAKYCNVKYGVATSNGTTALHLALQVLGITEGDEVIVPTLTFIATANVVSYVGAKPVFVESDPDYWGIDPNRIEEKITSRTKAIIPVHLYGHPCDMDPILAIAKRHKLYVVEDAAEAHGAEYKGKKAGSLGDIGCFSFFGNKTMTTGEGGMCITNNRRLAEGMRILRSHGMNPHRKYWHDVIGFNYRMTNLQAALGVAQLHKLERFVAKKRTLASWYQADLQDLEDEGLIRLHPQMSWASCMYWMYSILIQGKSGITRDALMKKLGSEGIETRPFFYPVHTMPPHRTTERFNIAARLSKQGMNLPSGTNLKRDDVRRIARCIRKYID